jgi:hypothetical protein
MSMSTRERTEKNAVSDRVHKRIAAACSLSAAAPTIDDVAPAPRAKFDLLDMRLARVDIHAIVFATLQMH